MSAEHLSGSINVLPALCVGASAHVEFGDITVEMHFPSADPAVLATQVMTAQASIARANADAAAAPRT